mgnify:FL=1
MTARRDLLTGIAKLRATLLVLEETAQLDDLSEQEIIVLSAAASLAADGQSFSSRHLENHELISDMPVSTFFRNLRQLVEKGYLKKSGHHRSAIYALNV